MNLSLIPVVGTDNNEDEEKMQKTDQSKTPEIT